MKKKRLKKKLVLNKKTIATLDNHDMLRLRVGGTEVRCPTTTGVYCSEVEELGSGKLF